MGYTKEHYKEEWEELKWEMKREEQFEEGTNRLTMTELRNLTDPLINEQEFDWEHFRAQYNNEQPIDGEPESAMTKFVRERIRKFYEKG